jgi:TMEM175 potassium channel family protein
MVAEKQDKEGSLEKETGRLEAFSDGVFAVAITLLVIDLKVPILQEPLTPQKLTGELLSQWPSYIAFLISFATILIMWVNHHNMFKLIHKSDTVFLFANGFLLLLVTSVPFPTALVSEYLDTSAAVIACVVYCGLFVIINVAYNLLWWSAVSHHLLKPTISHSLIRARARAYLLGFPSYLLALIVAFWNPFVSIAICALLWVFWSIATYDKTPILGVSGE